MEYARARPRPLPNGRILCGPLFLAILLFIALMSPSRAAAAPCTVTSGNDGGDGSLRGAISSSACDTIDFDLPAGSTIALTDGALPLNRTLTIDGGAVQDLTISGENQSRLFEITSRAVVTLTHLNLANGRALSGGAILVNNGSRLVLSNSTLHDNNALCSSITCDGGAVLVNSIDPDYTTNPWFKHNEFTGNLAGTFGGAFVIQPNTWRACLTT